MKCFDIHLHAAAPESLERTFAYHLDYLAYTDTERAAILSIPSHAGGMKYGETCYMQNPRALFYKLALPGRAYAFYGLEQDKTLTEAERRRDLLRQVETAHRVGFDGVKLLEGKPSLRRELPYLLSSPDYEDMFAYLEERQIPVLLHNADPAFFWDKDKVQPWHITLGWYVEETQLRKHEMLEDVMTVLKRHPGLHLTLAHMGFMSDSIEDAERFFSYENTTLDVTPGGEQLIAMAREWEKWGPFFEKYGDRILFGTDRDGREPWDPADFRDDPYLAAPFLKSFFLCDGVGTYGEESYRGVGLSEAAAERLFYSNALRLLGEPRLVDEDYFWARVAALEGYYADDEARLSDLRFMRKHLGRPSVAEARP